MGIDKMLEKGETKMCGYCKCNEIEGSTAAQGLPVVDNRRAAYDRFKSHRKNSVKDMDYKAELLEALDEKFGCAE